MSLWIDIKYVNLLSVQLELFVIKKSNPYLANFRCNLCGDSKKNKRKARGYIYQKLNSLFYKCHKCGSGMSFGNLLKQINPSLFKQYTLERFKENGDIEPKKKLEFSNFTPMFEEKNVLDRAFDKISELPDTNPGVRYLKHRMIPRDKWNNLYFTFETSKLGEVFPEYEESVDGDTPRILIPFFDKKNNLVGVTARDVYGKNKLRYVTIKIDKEQPLIYNINNVDRSKEIFVTEGPFDSMFLDNSIAVNSSDLKKVEKLVSKSNTTLVFDNQPRNPTLVKIIRNAMFDGWKCVVWPNTVKEKDINEMIMNGVEVKDIIYKHTYSGMRLRLELNKWSKC